MASGGGYGDRDWGDSPSYRGRGDYRGGYRGRGGGGRGFHSGGGRGGFDRDRGDSGYSDRGRGRGSFGDRGGGGRGGGGGFHRGGRGDVGGGYGPPPYNSQDYEPIRSGDRHVGYDFAVQNVQEPAAAQGQQVSKGRGKKTKKTPQPVGAAAEAYPVEKMEALDVKDKLLPIKRPGVGTAGTKIMLAANHFPIKIPSGMLVFHYDMSMAEKCKRKIQAAKAATKSKSSRSDQDVQIVVLSSNEDEEEILRKRVKWPRHRTLAAYTHLVWTPGGPFYNYRYKMAYDKAKNIFSQCDLGLTTETDFTVTVPHEDKPDVMETFIVTLKLVRPFHLDLHSIFDRLRVENREVSTTVLDVILQQSKIFSHFFIPMNRRIFYRPKTRFLLSGYIERYPGIWESIRPVSGWQCTLNLDLANTAFVKPGSLLDVLKEIGYGDDPSRIEAGQELAKRLDKIVKGIKVDLMQRGELRKRSARCNSVSFESARDLTFLIDKENGRQERISVVKYFELQHKSGQFVSSVRFPNLPCLHVGNRNRHDYIPLEFCVIREGQRYPRKLDSTQTAEMLKVASQPAPERRQRIEDEVERFNINNDPYLKNFGISVDTKMVTFEGRILPAPSVEYSGSTPAQMVDGGWNMRNVRVISACPPIKNYAVICANNRISEDEIMDFCRQLAQFSGNMGVHFESQKPMDIIYGHPEHGGVPELKQLVQGAGGKKPDLVLVILPFKDPDSYYDSVKAAGDVDMGISTQCILSKNVQRASPSLCANIALKINTKLGGTNSKLAAQSLTQVTHMKKPILILGADVNHPASTDPQNAPSVAAIVGCIDPDFGRYISKIYVQDRRVEFITDLDTAVKHILYSYVSRHRVLPEKIVMYRDGVGESMFTQVLADELHAIRKACTAVLAKLHEEKKFEKTKVYEPPITFIVVQKRHHTRLFCVRPQDAMGRGNNVPPGTVVDTDIVHPIEFDFYLLSHLGLQGTSRPGHYHVLWDDNQFSADLLQKMTYYLCYTYARATKAVSIPPPVYYADAVAFRARKYISAKSPEWSDPGLQPEPLTAKEIEKMQQYVDVDRAIEQKGMYFV